jgi:hypothetical protein
MHLSNHPWSGVMKADGTDVMERNSVAVRMNPAALQTGGPAAVFAAQNARRSAVLSACSELLPWMEAQRLGSAAAQERQRASLGFVTKLPEGVSFTARRPLTVPSVLSDKGEPRGQRMIPVFSRASGVFCFAPVSRKTVSGPNWSGRSSPEKR